MGISKKIRVDIPQLSSSILNTQIRGDYRFPYSLFRIFSFLLISCAFLSGCVTLRDPEASQEYRGDIVGTISPGSPLGQTIISRRPRLNRIELWLRPLNSTSANQQLIFELYYSPDENQPLVTLPIKTNQISKNFPIHIKFEPQNDPPDQRYFIKLKTQGEDIQVYGREEDVYPQGAMFVENSPQPRDISFRLSYDYNLGSAINDIDKTLRNSWLIVPFGLTLFLPGWIFFRTARKELDLSQSTSFDWGEITAISLGISLAIFPVFMLWTSTLGIKLNRLSILIMSSGLITIAFLQFWRERRTQTSRNLRLTSPSAIGIILLIIFLTSFAVRLIMVRDLAAPAWVDSVHHATISQLIIEQGAYPATYSPYVKSLSASYHPGFHSIVALFNWLSNLEMNVALLLLGQVLNALAVLAVYLFTISCTGDRIAGLVAAMITGLVSPMPAYYTSWGRYTQLCGLLIMVVCIALFKLLLTNHNSQINPKDGINEKISAYQNFFLSLVTIIKDKPYLFLTVSITFAGLFLTHYRVYLFLAVFFLAWLISLSLQSIGNRTSGKNVVSFIGLLIITGIFSILIANPWWSKLIMTRIVPSLALVRNTLQPFHDFSWGFLTTAYGKQALILAGMGLGLSILRAKWFGPTLTLWVSLLFLIANPGALRIPQTGFVNNTSVEIMLFLPVSVLGGYFVSFLINFFTKFLPQHWRWLYFILWGALGVIIAFCAARALIPILNPITFFYRSADTQAMSWIRDNIPEDETVLINPFLWGYGIYAGQDGGYWISPLAGRSTMPPPAIYGYGSVEDKQEISNFSRQIIEFAEQPEALHQHLSSKNIKYIYIGARGGAISVSALRQSPIFDLIYANNGTWVFLLKEPLKE